MITVPFLATGAFIVLWLAIFRVIVFLAPDSFFGRGFTLLQA